VFFVITASQGIFALIPMKLSIVIVSYNVRYFLEVCLDSVIAAARGIDAEIIVVDNNSTDGSPEMVRRRFPSVTVLENKENLGFSKANNQGFQLAKGEYILILNPDTVMPGDFFAQTLAYMDTHPEAGAIGPRLIDGKGSFSPDGKKSFPTLSVALFKTIGLNKLFPRSTLFNKYYAVHVGERETAAVDVLSGCCMMVRTSVLQQVGGGFDDDYFMYCEDVDLSFRIKEKGYKNIYFPEVSLVHYKGESTRKATISYVRTFNSALATFVKKHYGKKNARVYIFVINIGIVFRAILSGARRFIRLLRLPLFDALVLLATLWFVKDFWTEQVKNIIPIPFTSLLITFPVYMLIWVASLFLNGVYDQAYRALRVIRGMFIGTVLILAYYGILPPELRHSRGIIIFSGFAGTVTLLALHEVLFRLGIFKFVKNDRAKSKAVIVASPHSYTETIEILQKVHYAPHVIGRISPGAQAGESLGTIDEMKSLLYAADVNEVIFCVNGLSYSTILTKMEQCGKNYDYKIHLPGSRSFVGSNSAQTAGDLYTIDKRYNITFAAQRRNKRLIDVSTATALIALAPLLLFFVKRPAGFFANCFSVLTGKRTWISYTDDADTTQLPKLKKGILPPYNLASSFIPADDLKSRLNMIYAEQYTPATDLMLILKNIKYLGR
jgi:GT2 family glycosyltransferase